MNDYPLEQADPGTVETKVPPRWPWAEPQLYSTLKFLAAPALLAVSMAVLDFQLPKPLLYAVAVGFGMALFIRSMKDPEWLLAVFVIYIPLQKMYVAPLAPGINGTNALMAMMLFAWAMQSLRSDAQRTHPLAHSKLVMLWLVVSLASIITAVIRIGAGHFFSTYTGDVKGWLDQFIVFYTFLTLIRDGNMARRVVVYMMLGMLVSLAFGVQEWWDKRWLDSIEKARVEGPPYQPNDYGAFLVYATAPFMALFLDNIWRVRTWLMLSPVLLMTAKILLATFSRGAYVAMAMAGLVAGYVRGKWFLIGSGVFAVAMLIAMPELIPESLTERMSQTTQETGTGEELDTSSQTRLILWEAAIDMTLENPVFGKGFKQFPLLKSQYTEIDVRESDTHNMYLYICSQMGIPALLIFLLLVWRMYAFGVRIYREADEPFARSIGLGAAGMAAGVAAINMFGSRMGDVVVSAYFWIMLTVLAHLWAEVQERNAREET